MVGNILGKAVASCRNLNNFSAQFSHADGAVNNAVIAACIGTGSINNILLHCFGRSVTCCRAFFSNSILSIAAIVTDSSLGAILFAGCIVVGYVVGEAVASCCNLNSFSAQFSVTDGAVNNAVIAAGVGAGSINNILLHCFSGSMLAQFLQNNSLHIGRAFTISDDESSVNNLTFNGTGCLSSFYLHCIFGNGQLFITAIHFASEVCGCFVASLSFGPFPSGSNIAEGMLTGTSDIESLDDLLNDICLALFTGIKFLTGCFPHIFFNKVSNFQTGCIRNRGGNLFCFNKDCIFCQNNICHSISVYCGYHIVQILTQSRIAQRIVHTDNSNGSIGIERTNVIQQTG